MAAFVPRAVGRSYGREDDALAKRVVGLPAGRPHSGQAGRSLHQRRRREARAVGGFCRGRFMQENPTDKGEALAGNLAQRRQL